MHIKHLLDSPFRAYLAISIFSVCVQLDGCVIFYLMSSSITDKHGVVCKDR